jgi:hypothetical protein
MKHKKKNRDGIHIIHGISDIDGISICEREVEKKNCRNLRPEFLPWNPDHPHTCPGCRSAYLTYRLLEGGRKITPLTHSASMRPSDTF